jgi:hypothetical protein
MNPVNHPRIYSKYAKSQLQEGFHLSICGKATDSTLDPNIQYYVHPDFKRLSLSRLYYNIQLFFKIPSISADIYFIHSPELLWIACFYSIFSKSTWIYDVHEKYEDNIQYHKGWPWGLKKILAWFTGLLEKISVKLFLDGVVYAEKGFNNHLQAKNYCVLPNGIERLESNFAKTVYEKPYVLVSGNISEDWGSLRALQCYERYFATDYDLIFIGKCPNETEMVKLHSAIEKSKYANQIKTIGIQTFVPHSEILHWTQQASFVFCLYEDNPAINNRIPSKMMEAWAFQTPIIFSPIKSWKKLNEKYQFGISVDEIAEIPKNFYPHEIPASAFLWESMYQHFSIWFHKNLKSGRF